MAQHFTAQPDASRHLPAWHDTSQHAASLDILPRHSTTLRSPPRHRTTPMLWLAALVLFLTLAWTVAAFLFAGVVYLQ